MFFFEDPIWCPVYVLSPGKALPFTLQVSKLSLYKQSLQQIYFAVHTAVLVMRNNLLTLWTQTAYMFSFSFPFSWGSRLTTTKGRELSKIIWNQQYFFLSTGTPTYWPSDPDKIPDLLDFYITSSISTSYMAIVPSYDLSLDHTPVIATISTEVVNK
jgi:hypothetical protein